MEELNKHIFWIASYPKSGNTLLRSILTALFFTKDGLFNFDLLKNIPIIEDTINLDFIKKTNADDYNNIHELRALSKYWLKIQSKKNLGFNGDFLFVKTHHALVEAFSNPFTSESNTRGIIYIVRDPRDVVVSYSHHFNISIEKSTNQIINSNTSLSWRDGKNLFLNKKKPITVLNNWKFNYESWVDNKFKCPFLLIRYEDLVSEKLKTIKKIINFFEENYGFKFNNLNEKTENILSSTNFKAFQSKEKSFGFVEGINKNFFRKGESNQWKNILEKSDILKIENSFHSLMKKLGYKTLYYN